MEALYLLVPLSIGIVFVAIRVFFWMSDSGQFDDMVGPGLRLLEDADDSAPEAPVSATPIGNSSGPSFVASDAEAKVAVSGTTAVVTADAAEVVAPNATEIIAAQAATAVITLPAAASPLPS